MSIPAVGAVGFTPYVPPTVPTTATESSTAATDATGAQGAAGTDFAKLLSNGLENLQGMHSNVDSLAVQAATGNLDAIHDYTIAATQASVATQLTTAVRNKAL